MDNAVDIGDKMKLTELELISLIDLHATQLPDLACDVVHGEGDVADIYRAIERIRELVALLPTPVVAEEGQRLQ